MARYAVKGNEGMIVISMGRIEGIELRSAVVEYNAMNDYAIFLKRIPQSDIAFMSTGFKDGKECLLMVSNDRGKPQVKLSACSTDGALPNEVISDMYGKSPVREDDTFTTEMLKRSYDEAIAERARRGRGVVDQVYRAYIVVMDASKQKRD